MPPSRSSNPRLRPDDSDLRIVRRVVAEEDNGFHVLDLAEGDVYWPDTELPHGVGVPLHLDLQLRVVRAAAVVNPLVPDVVFSIITQTMPTTAAFDVCNMDFFDPRTQQFIVLSLALAGAVIAIVSPERGVQDRAADTRLVPR